MENLVLNMVVVAEAWLDAAEWDCTGFSELRT